MYKRKKFSLEIQLQKSVIELATLFSFESNFNEKMKSFLISC